MSQNLLKNFLQGFRVDHLLKASLNFNLLLFLLLQEGHVDELDTKKAIAVFQNLTVCIQLYSDIPFVCLMLIFVINLHQLPIELHDITLSEIFLVHVKTLLSMQFSSIQFVCSYCCFVCMTHCCLHVQLSCNNFQQGFFFLKIPILPCLLSAQLSWSQIPTVS